MKKCCCLNSWSLTDLKTIHSRVIFYQMIPFIFLIGISLSLYVLADKHLESTLSVSNLKRHNHKELSHASLTQTSLNKVTIELEYYSNQ